MHAPVQSTGREGPPCGLDALARLYGVQPSYRDVDGRERRSPDEAVLRVLRLLGVPVEGPGELADAVRERWRELWGRVMEPVVVAWEGEPSGTRVHLPASAAGPFRCRVMLEDGGELEWEGAIEGLHTLRRRTVGGVGYVAKRLSLPDRLERGYHRLSFECGGRTAEALLMAAPREAYGAGDAAAGGGRLWGVFLPLYALHRESSWGAGDFSDLGALMEWMGEVGGRMAATLPMLATLWELGGDPSPYSPTSRLFWNELYLDVSRIAELERCPAARRLLESDTARRELSALRGGERVDYHRLMRLKGPVLRALADCFFTGTGGERRAAFERFCEDWPRVRDFARFRAACECTGRAWGDWPPPMRDGLIAPGDYDERDYRYHLYAQWQVEGQIGVLAERARQAGRVWYLDLPLGVSGGGYDVWRERDVFATAASGGAPPDTFFTGGQNWGFPPIHPHRARERGHDYFIAVLRRHLRLARVLRIDHVMSLHRMYWVPDGMGAQEGVYVRSPSEELFAILSLESHRQEARIIGENLGTVPEVVNRLMRRHGVRSTYVLQYEVDADRPGDHAPLAPVPATSAASLNTHDMPPFAAFWSALDVDDRLDLRLLDEHEAEQQRRERARMRQALVDDLRRRGWLEEGRDDVESVIEACGRLLGASEAEIVLLNLEDLWAETNPQNVPGTMDERPNWRRKARHSFDRFSEMPSVLRILRAVDEARRSKS